MKESDGQGDLYRWERERRRREGEGTKAGGSLGIQIRHCGGTGRARVGVPVAVGLGGSHVTQLLLERAMESMRGGVTCLWGLLMESSR